MAKVIWAVPALNDLDAIADYIALDNPAAARELVQRVFGHVDQLIIHPDSGSKPRELRGGRYRQIVEQPCRIFYRREGETIYVLHVMRGERKLRPRALARRSKNTAPETREAIRSSEAPYCNPRAPPDFPFARCVPF
jgi:plasmid stabilization system protein ParE